MNKSGDSYSMFVIFGDFCVPGILAPLTQESKKSTIQVFKR